MKNIIFLLLIVISFSCKKEDPKPISKSAPLLIEFTGNDSSPIYCKLNCSVITPGNRSTDTANTVTYTINQDIRGDQSMIFSSIGYDQTGYKLVYGSYDVKVTYNGQVLFEHHFTNNSGVGCTVKLPFVQ